jgi:cellulose synthase/poly-beta-1,6-N-acetylglucosamine synthase-like glycosyltransferase
MSDANPPFVSVVVPVYNDQPGLDRCIDALLAQGYPADRYEIVVIDNGSDPPVHTTRDGPVPIRIAVCHMAGSYAARNMGIAGSQGDICAFTDADCIPHHDWIERGVEALLATGGGCIIGGAVGYHAPDSRSATALYQYLVGFPQRTNVTERGFAATANLFACRSHFERVGMFNTDLLSGGDLEWCLRAGGAGINAVFCEAAMVMTAPRADLYSAIRQARRVAGGRYLMRASAAAGRSDGRLRPHRSALPAISWVLSQRDLSAVDRLRILFVASVIKAAQLVEVLRLSFGGKPERR